jgi:predicted RNA-binding Zn ribbon-like protein
MSPSNGVAGEEASSALALVNTRHLRSGQPADLLADPARAAEWLAGRGLVPRGTRLSDPETARLVALREAVRGLFAARAGQRTPAAGDVATLNAALTAATVIPSLTWDEAGPRQSEQAPAAVGPFAAATALLARDALPRASGAQTGAATGSAPPGTTPATAAQPNARYKNVVDGPSTTI